MSHPISRLLGVLVSALLLAAAGLVLLTPPAQAACSCQVPSVAQASRQADLVITGVLVGERRDQQRVELTLEAERIYRGQVESASVEVASPADGCGLRLAEDQTYVVFAVDGRNGLVSGRCDGTVRASSRTVRDLERALGPGERYREPAPEPAEPTYTRLLDTAPPDFARMAAPGAAMALIGLLGWVVVRRRT